MTAPAPGGVSLSPRAIAAGMVDEEWARVTLSLDPDTSPGPYSLADWPAVTSAFVAALQIKVVSYPSGPEQPPVTHRLAWEQPERAVATSIAGFWRRMMAPGGGAYPAGQSPWDDLWRALDAARQGVPEKDSLILSPPDPQVALAHTLRRGRRLLDALSASPAALHDAAAHGAPEDVLKRFRQVTRDARDGSPPRPVWPTSRAFAQAALHGAAPAGGAASQLEAAHLYATPMPDPDLLSDKGALQTAYRRLGALMALPTLQRLFGLAVDVEVRLADLAGRAGASGLVQIATQDANCWTLARVTPASGDRPATFWPARRAGPDTGALRNLGETTDHGARYDLCTVDPALAAEAARPSAGSDRQSDALPDLRHGGLRVLDTLAATALAQRQAADASNHVNAVDANAAKPMLQGAEDLAVGDRLLIGIRTADGLALRSPLYRHITFEDPEPPAGASPDWLEDELSRRHLCRCTPRRMALDAAVVHQPTLSALTTRELDQTGLTDEQSLDKEHVLIAQASIAVWNGEPMGVPPGPRHAGRKPSRTEVVAVIGELDVTRRFAAPSSRLGDGPELLCPLMRLGRDYYAVMATTFVCGIGATAREAEDAVAATPSLALPAPDTQVGRRLLRHERLLAPSLAFTPPQYEAVRRSQSAKPDSTMVVRSSAARPQDRVASAARVLLPPAVPLYFAALHGVLDTLAPGTRSPPQSLPGLTFSKDDKSATRVQVAARPADAKPYFRDPAMSNMVMRLQRAGSDGMDGLVGPPLKIPMVHPWPETRAVHLELVAAPANAPPPRLVHSGPGWLGHGELLSAKPGGVPVELVQLALRPGEAFNVLSWCVPSVEDLAAWFDAVQAAGALATLAGEGVAGDSPDAACAAGLRQLVGKDILPGSPPPRSCTGPGHLAVPALDTLTALAALVQQTMLQKPVTLLAAVLTLAASHAIDPALVPAPELPEPPRVTRRIFAGGDNDIQAGESRLEFLSTVPVADWSLAQVEEGATDLLLGGTVTLDLASTVALEIEVSCVSPDADVLDARLGRTPAARLANDWSGIKPDTFSPFGFKLDAARRPIFPKASAVALRIDGLPQPQDGLKGKRSFQLEELQAAAWGGAQEFGAALRVSTPKRIVTCGARRLTLTPYSINRHASAASQAGASARSPAGAAHTVWLPATQRPDPPSVSHMHIGLMLVAAPAVTLDGRRFAVSASRTTSVRIWLDRGWFSSGEGEQLGLVLVPPGLAATGVMLPGLPGSDMTDDFLDEDLGPGGQFVTRWGADAHRDGPQPNGPLMSAKQIRLLGADQLVPARMPVPVGSQPLAPPDPAVPTPDPKLPAGGRPLVPQAPAPTPKPGVADFLAVALRVADPRFDPVEELWYVDAVIDTGIFPMPRVRIGLVRYQAHAREDGEPIEGTEPVRLRTSFPVARWVNPLPGRRVEATCSPRANATEVLVSLTGPASMKIGSGGTPHVIFELLQRDRAQGTEQIAIGADGKQLCLQSDIDDQVVRTPFEGGMAWVGRFLLPDSVDSGGFAYAVVVNEAEQMLSAATERDGSDTKGKARSGPKFIARLELDRSFKGSVHQP